MREVMGVDRHAFDAIDLLLPQAALDRRGRLTAVEDDRLIVKNAPLMVKNIAPPIRAFRLRLGKNSPEQEVPTAGETAEPLESPSAGATISDLLPTTKLRSSWHSGTALRTAALPSSTPTSGSIPRELSPRSPEPGLML